MEAPHHLQGVSRGCTCVYTPPPHLDTVTCSPGTQLFGYKEKIRHKLFFSEGCFSLQKPARVAGIRLKPLKAGVRLGRAPGPCLKGSPSSGKPRMCPMPADYLS